MLEAEAQVEGLGPEKTVMLLFKDDRGTWHQSELPLAKSIEAEIDEILGWLGKTVKVRIEKGEIEGIELVEP